MDHLGGLVFCLFVLTATDQSAYRTRPAMSPPKAKCMTGQGTAPKFIPVFAASLWHTAFALSSTAYIPRAVSSGRVLSFFYGSWHSPPAALSLAVVFLIYSVTRAVFSEQGACHSMASVLCKSWLETGAVVWLSQHGVVHSLDKLVLRRQFLALFCMTSQHLWPLEVRKSAKLVPLLHVVLHLQNYTIAVASIQYQGMLACMRAPNKRVHCIVLEQPPLVVWLPAVTAV